MSIGIAFRRRFAAVALAAAGTAGAAAGGVYLASGDRYRLYTDDRVSQCWRAAGALASPNSRLRFERVVGSARPADRPAAVAIDYRLDRVLGGRTLTIECTYRSGRAGADSIALDGRAVDPETLETVNREVGR